MKTLVIIKYVFALIGLGLLVAALAMAMDTRDFLGRAARAQGTVIDLVSQRSSDNAVSYHPEVAFSDNQGSNVHFVSPSGSNPPSYHRGERVEVLYLPDEPEKARIHDFLGTWFAPLLLGAIGLVFFTVGAGMIAAGMRKSRRRKRLLAHGRRIDTDQLRVERNTALTVNGRHPFQVVAQWQDPSNATVHEFRSDNLWFDPTQVIKGKTIHVFMDRNNPSSYVVDLPFMPSTTR